MNNKVTQKLELEAANARYTGSGLHHLVLTFVPSFDSEFTPGQKLYWKCWLHTNSGFDLAKKVISESFGVTIEKPNFTDFTTIEAENYVKDIEAKIVDKVGTEFTASLTKDISPFNQKEYWNIRSFKAIK